MFLITIECSWNCQSSEINMSSKMGGIPFQTREVQQGIPRNLGTNPYISTYVETVSCGKFFLTKILQKSSQGPTKVLFFFFIKTSKWEKWWSCDLEWRMLSYYVIYCEKFRTILQRTEKVALKVEHVPSYIYMYKPYTDI